MGKKKNPELPLHEFVAKGSKCLLCGSEVKILTYLDKSMEYLWVCMNSSCENSKNTKKQYTTYSPNWVLDGGGNVPSNG